MINVKITILGDAKYMEDRTYELTGSLAGDMYDKLTDVLDQYGDEYTVGECEECSRRLK